MRNRTIKALAVTLVLTLAALPNAIGQQGEQKVQQEQQQQTVEGVINQVDLDNWRLVVERNDDNSEIILELSEETEVRGPRGEATVQDLLGKEGTSVTARYEVKEQRNIALSVELLEDGWLAR
jgi:sulfur carrier protein ThiS